MHVSTNIIFMISDILFARHEPVIKRLDLIILVLYSYDEGKTTATILMEDYFI